MRLTSCTPLQSLHTPSGLICTSENTSQSSYRLFRTSQRKPKKVQQIPCLSLRRFRLLVVSAQSFLFKIIPQIVSHCLTVRLTFPVVLRLRPPFAVPLTFKMRMLLLPVP